MCGSRESPECNAVHRDVAGRKRGDMADEAGIDRLDQQLADAIEDGRLRAVLGDLATCVPPTDRADRAGRERLQTAVDALASIDEAIAAETADLLAALSARGVQAAAGPADDRPIHMVTVHIDRNGRDRARAVLEAAGYRWLGPAHPAAWRAHRTMHASAAFRREGDTPFRVELTWPAAAAGTRIGRLLAPQMRDLDAIALPAALWPLYVPVRVARLVRRAVRRAPGPTDLGPYLETPHALIGPLLAFADVGPDDLLVDLGCGDGRIVVEAARRTGCRARGVELDRDLAERARAAVAAAGLADRVEIVHGDATGASLADATVVVVFLPVGTVEALLPDLLARMAVGARLVAHEQERLRPSSAPDERRPLLTAGGITVAHRWNR
jgi:SAM-dependent methyltransferase